MRKILKFFAGRKILGFMFLTLQLAILLFPVLDLYERQASISVVIGIMSLVVIIYEINRQTDSGFKLIWIAIIAIFPVFGIFLYLYVHFDIIMLNVKKRLGFLAVRISQSSRRMGLDTDNLIRETKEEWGILNYLSNQAQSPCYRCENSTYFPLGEDMFSCFMEDVKNAKKYIFLEYFIINESDYMWQTLFSVLCQKAGEGVDVRLIYDAMGCITTVKGNFAERVREKGIKCYPFSPVKPFVSTYHNNRDHRKMAIIDGKYAYTGGVNIADEYINQKERFGHWKDTAIRIQGEAVQGFLLLFFKLWNFVCTNKEEDNELVQIVKSQDTRGFVVPFDDTPLDTECVTRNVYLHIINTAHDYVYINTPYLILDDALRSALKFASGRGVDVRICMPHIPDKAYAFALGRSYYPELIACGIKIYEYTPGFLHAKSTVSDDKRLYIGSANYDYRSLYLHYECGVYMYNTDVISKVREDFENTLNNCILFTEEEYRALNVFYRTLGKVLRLFAALM